MRESLPDLGGKSGKARAAALIAVVPLFVLDSN
jgi:hypothetical protein